MKGCYRILFLLLLVLHTLFSAASPPLRDTESEKTALRFRADGSFKIVQFTDLHYGEGEDVPWGPIQDVNSTRVMHKVLDYEDADLVVFTGDQITGNNIRANATAYWLNLLQPCRARQLRWATIFGNHDDLPLQQGGHNAVGSTTSRSTLMALDSGLRGSYSQAGPAAVTGVSNYHLTVDSPRFGQSQALFFFDTGGGTLNESIDASQVSWYRNASAALEANGVRNGIAFLHIPLPEYTKAAPASLADLHARRDLTAGQPTCFGMRQDGINPFDDRGGLFNALKAEANVHATFVGHDHGNDWCCKYQGVWLCFGRHSGYGGYGDWQRGARVIVLREGNITATQTYVRLENGNIIDQGRLW